MSEPSDQQLLSDWVTSHDEAAFRSLAGKYAGFVFGAIVRRVGDQGLAEEISQDVFARLSQNARQLLDHPTIAGWLHRTAMLMALDRVRRRTRNTRTLGEFAQMNHSNEARDPWADALPHLDQSLDRLSAPEREVLMLHFAERRTFPEIAARLGSTPDAVRMRTNRALASLSRMIGKKGAAIPASVLAAGLAGTFAQSAPAAVASLTPIALVGFGKVSPVSVVLHSFQTMNTAKAFGAAGIALALCVPLAVQQRQIAKAEARIASLQRSAEARNTSTSQPAIAPIGTTQTKRDGQIIDLKGLAEAALNGDYFSDRRIRHVIDRLDTNNLAGLIETALHGGMMPAPREALLQKLLGELHKRDPALFLEWSIKVLAGTVPTSAVRSSYALTLRSNAEKGFRSWMAAQPAQAAAWAEANEDAWKQFGGASLRTLTVAGLLEADPPRAYACWRSAR
jgi:RNA polymerase sigma factor (sigma-70 family)